MNEYKSTYNGCWEQYFTGKHKEAVKYFIEEYQKMFGKQIDFDIDNIAIYVGNEDGRYVDVEE